MSVLARALAGAAVLAVAGPLVAQPQPASNTLPTYVPAKSSVPDPQDVPYPGGTIRLDVDATQTAQGIFRVKETIPVAQAGPMTLLYPKWIPGTHSPTGPIDKLAGLTITANGQPVKWTRDVYDVYAFHFDVPAGAREVVASFQYVSPTKDTQGGIVMTPVMLNLDWGTTSLYPAGYYTRRILVQPTAHYPAGWKSATALAPGLSGDMVAYPVTDYETMVDSPTLAGVNMVSHQLTPEVRLDIAADRPDQLVATPAQIDLHRKLVTQAVKLFGAQHYNHYDFLLWLSDTMGGQGLEHHRSSEDGTHADYFTDWDTTAPNRNLLPHEFTHSWDGKFRRGQDLWTPTYNEPMGDTLLWVYEGQTQYWGYVLQARSGLVSKADTLDALASTAAYYENTPAKAWRSVEDTTNDPTMSQRRPKPWRNYQWSEDYYEAGKLVWLDADQLIREKTGGRKSLDDFARAFFGIRNGDWGVVTYTYDDVVKTMNGVMPYDWDSFFRERIYGPTPKASLSWVERGGYKLTYTDKPNTFMKASDKIRETRDFSYSIGVTMGKDGAVSAVAWGSPAFQAGLTNGTKIVAVNDLAFDNDTLAAAITAAKGGNQPIRLLIRQNDQYRTVPVTWNGGLRYPHLEKTGKGEAGLDRLLAPKA